jgi:hypothetical protein
MLRENRLTFYTSKEIEPKGWLVSQLKIQAEGLSGNLDKVWPDVRDSRWIGGVREGWERVPYWLDGFIPLAYLLKDEDLIDRAKKYINAIIEGQKEDGWICPCNDNERGRYDLWALFLILKVLVLYHDCSGDERIEDVVYKALANLKRHVAGTTLFNWGMSRWFEALIPIYWMYRRREEEWLLRLARTLYAQGMNYKALYDNWDDMEPRAEWTFQTHVVNAAMAIKSEALMSQALKKEMDAYEFAEKMYSLLMEYHGMATMHFTGDECFAGNSPIHGTELCSVAEAMYSYEKIFEVTGKTKWLDRLENLAFNAFPATNSEDMWTHQYVQMTNQIECSRFKNRPIFYTNGHEANLFGLEPNYGCCTANFNQAWPKFALSTFAHNEKGIYSAVIAPAKLNTRINGVNVSIECITDYPFKNKVTYVLKAEEKTRFTFGIRIPLCVESATVEGKAVEMGAMHEITREWHEDTVEVVFEFKPKLVERPNDMFCLWYGPLLFALPIKEEWVGYEYTRDNVERKYPYCDYEVLPRSKWNYAFASKDFKVSINGIKDRPFSRNKPPVVISAEMYEINWGYEEGYDNVCRETPLSREPIGGKVEMILIPYGCSNLRMTEMPLLTCCN